MAAARRSSESKAVVFIFLFLILAVAGICTTVAFYQKYANLKKTVGEDQVAVETGVGKVFQANGWELAENSPPVMGFKYKHEAYSQVGTKLEEAAEYEKQVLPLLGWQSLSGIQSALNDAPVQQEAVQAGQAPLSTMKGLLDYYATTVAQLNGTVSDLRKQVASLTDQNDGLQTTLANREKELGQQISDLQKKQADDLAKVKKDYDDMVASFDAQRQKTQETNAKLQEEVNAHKADTSKLQDQVAALQQKVHELTVPGEGKKLTAQGKVISVEGQFDAVYIDGGKDKNRRENDTFVVYDRAPDGSDHYKGTVKITDVYDTTSRASIVQEKDLILSGDSFASTEQWDMFHPSKAAAPAAPAAAAPVGAAMAPAAGS